MSEGVGRLGKPPLRRMFQRMSRIPVGASPHPTGYSTIPRLRRAGIYSRRPGPGILRCMEHQTAAVIGRRAGRLETVPYGGGAEGRRYRGGGKPPPYRVCDDLDAFVGRAYMPADPVPLSATLRSFGTASVSEGGGRLGNRPYGGGAKGCPVSRWGQAPTLRGYSTIPRFRRAGIYARRPGPGIRRCMQHQTAAVIGRRAGRLETVPYGGGAESTYPAERSVPYTEKPAPVWRGLCFPYTFSGSTVLSA